ncbi:MAG: NAD-binding, UDP-glucose/GDP-mannose dehydrogenase family protein [Candidatus Woesebacteria bacterium GW2011_GWB1_43_14]|uniref:NAD-binding, UDP-glucose/GDP-mannose dehydrogenase family protein n=1 Tax=Candidatus Woesebacteria bacterium GW2011_GWB1_43_14 TaxID=1618578 RepID=A0A0G1DLR8_9BACT|nr:MAG: NAD-binding, UDP-glucose/GDP-mannose dehydrogenase family protein [Candidatus Woesebacteria bacterium GW2011_GWC1_42_9]KKS98810.1 MAG: NAD-binding, UDP-glucose/GDP-mannose dehydrogenase family protein [Candidatus Woesebacteria bacterium GW2011_GWB1_43_14]
MISVIIPSRNRPNELLISLTSLGLAKHGLEALVWLDDDDPQLDKYKEFFGSDPNVRLFIKERVGYKNTYVMLNFLCTEAKYDWILQFNDDAYMEYPHWFEIFKDFVREFEPTNQPIVINLWGQGETILNLFPLVSRKFIDLLGYYTMYPVCDDWIRMVGISANISYDLKGIKPKHRKYGGEDQLTDKTFEEVQNDRGMMKRTYDHRRTPYRQQLRQEISKIVDYNMSTESCRLSERIKTVGFIGLGKLGLPIAEAIAKRGFNVLGYDIKKVKTTLPLAKSINELVKKSDLVFCAVQTPHNPLFEGDKPLPKRRADFDYSYLVKAVKAVAAVNKRTNLTVISTCLPGTYNRVIKPLLSDKINYLYNPFFIAMGREVEDYMNPEFVLIGGDDTAILKHFYTKLHGRDRAFVTDITTAEGIKVFYNTFVTAKIVLGNMYGEFAHRLGMNVDDIHSALTKATFRLISPMYLKSGVGDGGGCHPRDNIALSFLAKKINLSSNLFDTLMTARENHMGWLGTIFKEEMKSSGLPGIILGKSFKPETSLQTGSPAILLANILKRKRVAFKHYEFDYPKKLPVAVYLLATQHPQYRELGYPKGSIVIDPFRYINKINGVKIIAIGKKYEI